MPTYYKCRYLKQWVAVKHRWRLTINYYEKQALLNKADSNSCSNTTISVIRAR